MFGSNWLSKLTYDSDGDNVDDKALEEFDADDVDELFTRADIRSARITQADVFNCRIDQALACCFSHQYLILTTSTGAFFSMEKYDDGIVMVRSRNVHILKTINLNNLRRSSELSSTYNVTSTLHMTQLLPILKAELERPYFILWRDCSSFVNELVKAIPFTQHVSQFRNRKSLVRHSITSGYHSITSGISPPWKKMLLYLDGASTRGIPYYSHNISRMFADPFFSELIHEISIYREMTPDGLHHDFLILKSTANFWSLEKWDTHLGLARSTTKAALIENYKGTRRADPDRVRYQKLDSPESMKRVCDLQETIRSALAVPYDLVRGNSTHFLNEILKVLGLYTCD